MRAVLQPGQTATTRFDCLDQDCTRLVPLRVEKTRGTVTRLTELKWPRSPVMAASSADLDGWGSVRYDKPPPTRDELLARGFIKPAGTQVRYLALDEAGQRAAAAELLAYHADPALWQSGPLPGLSEHEAQVLQAWVELWQKDPEECLCAGVPDFLSERP